MSIEKVREITKAKALEFDVQEYKEFDVEGKCSYTDYFIIMTGSSSVNIKALAEKIVYECKHSGIAAMGIEGLADGEWCLIDFGEVIINIMIGEKREHYKLEAIWDEM